MHVLDRIHRRIVDSTFLYAFTIATRILLAIGFIPPGLTKLLGRPFTLMGTETAIGAFFDAFFQSGVYYGFVGAAQVLAGLLLLLPRTATLGAVLYLPIIANISVITWSMGFRGTWLVTALMVLANLWLLTWDYDRLRPLLFPDGSPLPSSHRRRTGLTGYFPGTSGTLFRAAIGAAIAGGLTLMLPTRGLLPGGIGLWGLALGSLAVPLGLAALWAARRRRPSEVVPGEA